MSLAYRLLQDAYWQWQPTTQAAFGKGRYQVRTAEHFEDFRTLISLRSKMPTAVEREERLDINDSDLESDFVFLTDSGKIVACSRVSHDRREHSFFQFSHLTESLLGDFLNGVESFRTRGTFSEDCFGDLMVREEDKKRTESKKSA